MDWVTAAAFGKKIALLNSHFFFFMEQAPDNFLKRKRWVGKLGGGDGRRHDFDMRPLRMVEPHMQTLAAFLTLGQMLDQQAARHTTAIDMVHGNANEGRDLFGLHEIILRRISERLALKWHDALITATTLARGLHPVKSDREIALPEDAR